MIQNRNGLEIKEGWSSKREMKMGTAGLALKWRVGGLKQCVEYQGPQERGSCWVLKLRVDGLSIMTLKEI